jgi:hypothetical protein
MGAAEDPLDSPKPYCALTCMTCPANWGGKQEPEVTAPFRSSNSARQQKQHKSGEDDKGSKKHQDRVVAGHCPYMP